MQLAQNRGQDIDVLIFDALTNTLDQYDYNLEKFIDICRPRIHPGNRPVSRCEKLWNSFINVARHFVESGQKSPLQAIEWLIETAFPIANIRYASELPSYSIIETPLGARRRIERDRVQVYQQLRKDYQRLYDYYLLR